MSDGNKLLDAILGLDPDTDEHWTADGMPRLDAVEEHFGGDVGGRKSVTNAAPDYTRAVALERRDALNAVDEDADADAVDVDADVDVDVDVDADADADENDPLAEGPADHESALTAAVQSTEDDLQELQAQLEEILRTRVAKEEELAKRIDEKNKAFPPLSPIQAIKQFQQNELARRAEDAAASALDKAMGTQKRQPRSLPSSGQ